MKTTLVMATYNGEKYIEEQLNSILHQSQQPDEVIIVDDKSTDCTEVIIKQFLQEHELANWEFHVNGVNLGFKENFRYALSLATNELIFLCDQDDVWEVNKIKIMTGIMEQNVSVKLLACGFGMIDGQGESIETDLRKGRSNNNLLRMSVEEGALVEVPFHIVAKENYAQGCCMCMKYEIVKDYLNIAEKEIEHDWMMALLASAKKGSFFYNKALISYRVHGENAIGVEDYISSHSDEYRGNRIQNRIHLLSQEKHRYEVIKGYKGSMEGNGAQKEIDWIDKRIEWIERKSVRKMIIGKLVSWRRPEYKMTTFGGDIKCVLNK